MARTSSQIGKELAEKTFKELGFIMGKDGKLREVNLPVSSRKSPSTPVTPFRIPVIEKTTRQAQSTQGYKASAHWQTAMLLHDLITLWVPILPISERRKREQIESAIWSVVSNIEEGWARPSTREYLDFIGFSQASLAEVRGGVERFATKGLLKQGNYGIPTPSRNFPYPPVASRQNPTKYGTLREKLREFAGKEIKSEDVTYETLIELINKTDFLLKRTVDGLQGKIVRDEKKKLQDQLDTHWRKNW